MDGTEFLDNRINDKEVKNLSDDEAYAEVKAEMRNAISNWHKESEWKGVKWPHVIKTKQKK